MINIAVIIVNWNGKEHLEKCLPSLAAQTYKNFRTIIVDNGSEDGSVQFVREKYPEIELIELDHNTGFAYPNNLGIKKAFGDPQTKYIVALNNDIKAEPDFLEKLVDCAGRHSEAGAIQPKVLNFFDRGKIDCVGITILSDGTAHNRGYEEKDKGQYDREEEIFGANGTASLFTRAALEKTVLPKNNFFDADHFAYYEDVDLAWRMKQAGFKAFFCPEAKVFHVHSATGGRVSLLKAYYLHRNYFFTIIKNYPFGLMTKTLLARAGSYIGLVFNVFRKKKRETEMMQGNSKIRVGLVVLKAWGSVILNLPGLFKKRNAIQRRKNLNDKKQK